MKNRKLKLNELKVSSFVTGELNEKSETIKGGAIIGVSGLCNDDNTRKCSWPSNCACPSADFPCGTNLTEITIDWGGY